MPEDVFAANGINFESSGMASTAPSANPPPIPAPSAQTAKLGQTVQPIPASELTEKQPATGSVPFPPNPQQLEQQSLAGAGKEGSAQTAAAPPQSGAQSPQPQQPQPVDVFKKMDFQPEQPSVDSVNASALNAGLPVTGPDATAATMAAQKPDATPDQQAHAKAAQFVQDTQDQTMELARSRFSPEQIAAWQHDPIGFGEVFKRWLSPKYYLPGGEVVQAADALKVADIAHKAQAGEQLSPPDRQTLNDYLDFQLEQNIRGFTWGGKVAWVGAQIPAFVAEFAGSAGVGELAARAAVGGAEEVAARGALAMASRFATKAATASMVMVPQTILHYGEERLNDAVAITDKGQLIGRVSQESPAKAALLAFGHTAADVSSQLMAPGIGKYVIDPVTKALSTPMVAAATKLSPELTTRLYEAWRAVQPTATISKMFTQAGWAGMIEQLGVNRIDQIMNASIDYAGHPRETFDDYVNHLTPSKDQLMVEAGLIGIAGGLSASTGVVGALLHARGVDAAKAQETASNMTALEKDAFVEQNQTLPKSDAPTLAEFEQKQMLADRRKPQGSKAAANVVAGQTAATNEANPPPIQDEQSGFNAAFKAFRNKEWPDLYSEMVNDVQRIENLGHKAKAKGAQMAPGEDIPFLTSFTKATPAWIERNWTTDTTTWDAEGNQVTTGKGLKQIRDDFHNQMLTTEPDRQTREDDLDAFENAMTFLEDHSKKYNPVSDKDLARSSDDLVRLQEKYGDKLKWFETTAKEERDWDNRVLHNLVTSGLKTQDWYDATTAKREWYSPTARIVDDVYNYSVSGNPLAKDVTPSRIGALKQRVGSERELMNKTQARMRNSAIILQRSAVNKLRGTIAKFQEFYPEDVQVKAPAVLREAVEHSYDPKLRQKLEKLVEFLHGTVERQQGKLKEGEKDVLGVYKPDTRSILLARGTTEGTLTHEAGHMLDYVLGLRAKLLSHTGMKAELSTLAEDRIRSEINIRQPEGAGAETEYQEKYNRVPNSYREYILGDEELIANFFDSWVNSPKQTAEIAPQATKAFEQFIKASPQLHMLNDLHPSTARAVETLEREYLDPKGPKDSLPVYQKGRRMYMHMTPELAQAFKGLDVVQIGQVERLLGGIFHAGKESLQFGATSYPAFMLRHFYRAMFTSYLNVPSETGVMGTLKHFAVDIPKGIFSVVTKDESYRNWKSSSGGLRTFLDLNDKGLEKLHQEMFGEMNWSNYLNPKNWLELGKRGLMSAKEIADYSPRVAAFEQMKREGKSDLEAGWISLEATGNYIRHGSFVRRLNRYLPFFNDMVQAGDRFVRSFARNPAGYTIRGTAMITIPQLLLTGYYLYAADDETRREYLNLPDWRRAAFMNIKIGSNWVSLPRAFGPGYVFGGIPEAVFLHLYGHNRPELKNFWLRTLAQAATSLSPVFDWSRAMNPIMKSAIENITNYSFFMQRPLFYGDTNKTAPENQFNSNTSETAKALGKLFGISPVDIDNTVYNMGGQIGVYAEQLSDFGINAARRLAGEPVNEAPTRIQNSPLYGRLIAGSPIGTGSESYQEFEQNYDAAAQDQNRYKELTGQDRGNFRQANAASLGAYPPLNAAQTQVRHLEHEIRLTTENTSLTGQEKTDRINQYQARIQTIVEGANARYRQRTGE